MLLKRLPAQGMASGDREELARVIGAGDRSGPRWVLARVFLNVVLAGSNSGFL